MKRVILFLWTIVLFAACGPKATQIPENPQGWEMKDTPTEASLRALSPISEDIVWASGSGGVWMRTVDSGKSWDHGLIAGLDNVDFRSIQGINAEIAIAASAGQPAVIYKTIDGGENWKLVHQEGEMAFFDGISFVDLERGYVFGDPVDGQWMILETLNGGDSWFPLLDAPMAAEGEAGFAASASSFLAYDNYLWLGTGGTESNLWESEDQGKTWKKNDSPLIHGESSQGIFSITLGSKGEVVAVGGDYLAPEETRGNAAIFVIDDKSWAKLDAAPLGFRSGVTYFSKYHWLLTVGTSGSDFSTDGGKSWRSFSEEGFHAIKVSETEGSVWASGAKGKVARLTL